MSTTTEILFNSPALHSLKRDQLVKLCKIHSIKASGKNVDLIAKLKQHAETLPKDSPLSVAARSEPETESLRGNASGISRQSEQWEIIMDTIEEQDEEASQGGTVTSQRTCINGGTGEFGTGHSKSTKSSIKAIATSLGLKRCSPKSSKRSTSPPKSPRSSQSDDDELRQRSTRYSALPPATPETMPQTDHFVLDTRLSIGSTTETALPGTSMRPGVPAPPNARLSMGQATPSREAQPTTTIRLVNPLPKDNSVDNDYYTPGMPATPQLKPFTTTFDLTFASPAAVWPPPKPGDSLLKGIYPTLTFNDLPPSMPGSPAALPAKSPEPFVFGSPLPRHSVSDDAFRAAAASVLEEMNQRLREDGVDEIEDTIISKLHPHIKKEPPREIKPIPGSKKDGGEIADKFQALHEKEFQKMEGIDAVVRKRLQVKKSVGEERVVVGKKRKSSVLERDSIAPRRPSVVAGRASATRVISAGRRPKIPGGFGDEDDDESDAEEEDQRGGKRVKMDPDAPVSMQTVEEAEKQREAEDKRRAELEKEKEAIRRKLEANRIRRRSSVAQGGVGARKSIGGPRKSLVKPAPKPSRFGFLSSAKNLVANVWNRGKAPAQPAASSSTVKPEAVPKPEPPKAKMGPPSFVPTRKAEPAPARQTTVVASGSSKASLKKASIGADAQTSVASRARSPLPTFGSSSSGSSLAPSRSSVAMSSSSRTSSSMDTGSKSRMSNVSSMGTKASGARMSTMGSVGSMGTKKVLPPSTSRASVASSSRMSSVTSRLFAPTASSLAKTHRSTPSESSIIKPAPKPVVEEKKPINLDLKPPLTTNNNPVTSPPTSRNPKSPFGTPGAFSPRRGPIFSHPPSAIPTPVKKKDDGPAPSSKDPQAMSTSPDGLESAAQRPDVPARSLSGRKPRISRSRVIARLASQRAAAHGVTSTGATASRLAVRGGGDASKRLSGSHLQAAALGRRSVGAPRLSGGARGHGKTRSSIGSKVSRSSYGGGGGPRRPSVGSVGDGVLMSAKKRARQSEYYARRRSRVEPSSPAAASGSGPSRGA